MQARFEITGKVLFGSLKTYEGFDFGELVIESIIDGKKHQFKPTTSLKKLDPTILDFGKTYKVNGFLNADKYGQGKLKAAEAVVVADETPHLANWKIEGILERAETFEVPGFDNFVLGKVYTKVTVGRGEFAKDNVFAFSTDKDNIDSIKEMSNIVATGIMTADKYGKGRLRSVAVEPSIEATSQPAEPAQSEKPSQPEEDDLPF